MGSGEGDSVLNLLSQHPCRRLSPAGEESDGHAIRICSLILALGLLFKLLRETVSQGRVQPLFVVILLDEDFNVRTQVFEVFVRVLTRQA